MAQALLDRCKAIGLTPQQRQGMERKDEEVSGARKRYGLIVLVALIVLGGIATTWWVLGPQAEPSPEELELRRTSGPVQYFNLEPSFLVNFPHQGRQRYLQADISVMSRDEAALLAVQQHMPAIRHRLNNVLSAQVMLVFEDPSGIEALRQLAAQEVQKVLVEEIGREGVEDLLFTSFVMQ